MMQRQRSPQITVLCALYLAVATSAFGAEGPATEASVGKQAMIAFEDATARAGIDYVGDSYGAAWGDFNGDGLPDLYANNHMPFRIKPFLYLNKGDGTFRNVYADWIVENEKRWEFKVLDAHACAFADFDNDGDQDLLQLCGGSGDQVEIPNPTMINRLYVNRDGRLVDEGEERGLGYGLSRSQNITLLDYNNDGLLDFINGSWLKKSGASPSTLFEQRTGMTFVDVGRKVGLSMEENGKALVYAVYGDVTGDGTMDVLLQGARRAYDISQVPWRMVENLTAEPRDGYDAVIADFDGDLKPDVAITRGGEMALYVFRDGRLVDRTKEAGLSSSSKGPDGVQRNYGTLWSLVAADFDNDMDLDLFATAGNEQVNEPDVLFENLGDGTFRLVPGAGGAAGSDQGVPDLVVSADYDLDGFVDLFVMNGHYPRKEEPKYGPYLLFRNRGNGNHWIEIDLQGTRSNRDGMGARVFVTAGGKTQLREQAGGVHRKGQDCMRLHFGLGPHKSVDKVEVRWPSGRKQEITDVKVDQILKIVEPQ